MLKLDTRIDLDIGKFFRWWGGELAFLVPENLRKLLGTRRAQLVLRKLEDGLDADYSDEAGVQNLGSFSLDEEGVRKREVLFQERPELAEAELLLLLRPEQSLHKFIKLPAAAEENLNQVVAFEMDRLTPFKADQVYFAVRVLERLPETRQIRVGLVLAPRQKLDPILDELRAFGWMPERVDVGLTASGQGHDLLPEKYRRARSKAPQIITAVSAVIFVLLLAAALFSYYTVASKPLIQHHGGVTVLGYGSLVCTLPMLAWCAPELRALDWAGQPTWVWTGLLWQVVGGGFLGWLAWGWANERRGVARTAPLIYLMPLIAGLAAWVWGGEQFTAHKLLGAGVILGGVALAQFSPSRALPLSRQPPPEPSC